MLQYSHSYGDIGLPVETVRQHNRVRASAFALSSLISFASIGMKPERFGLSPVDCDGTRRESAVCAETTVLNSVAAATTIVRRKLDHFMFLSRPRNNTLNAQSTPNCYCPEFPISNATFQPPSFCFFQMVGYLPWFTAGFPSLSLERNSYVP